MPDCGALAVDSCGSPDSADCVPIVTCSLLSAVRSISYRQHSAAEFVSFLQQTWQSVAAHISRGFALCKAFLVGGPGRDYSGAGLRRVKLCQSLLSFLRGGAPRCLPASRSSPWRSRHLPSWRPTFRRRRRLLHRRRSRKTIGHGGSKAARSIVLTLALDPSHFFRVQSGYSQN